MEEGGGREGWREGGRREGSDGGRNEAMEGGREWRYAMYQVQCLMTLI